MTHTTAALPCPFCGNPPELTHMPIELFNGCIPTRERPAWMIRCAILFCLGPSAHSEISEADAIEKWNRRPSPAADEGAAEEICKYLKISHNIFALTEIKAILRKHSAVSPKAGPSGLEKLRAWNERYPAGIEMSFGPAKQAERELDAILAELFPPAVSVVEQEKDK